MKKIIIFIFSGIIFGSTGLEKIDIRVHQAFSKKAEQGLEGLDEGVRVVIKLHHEAVVSFARGSSKRDIADAVMPHKALSYGNSPTERYYSTVFLSLAMKEDSA